MSGTKKAFTLIGEEEATAPVADAAQAHAKLTALNTQALLLALRALSLRAVTAISNLMTIGLVASAWLLWRSVLANPTTAQLIGVGAYAVFVLLIDVVRRRRYQ